MWTLLHFTLWEVGPMTGIFFLGAVLGGLLVWKLQGRGVRWRR